MKDFLKREKKIIFLYTIFGIAMISTNVAYFDLINWQNFLAICIGCLIGVIIISRIIAYIVEKKN